MVYVVRIELEDNEIGYEELEQDLYNNDKIVDVDLSDNNVVLRFITVGD